MDNIVVTVVCFTYNHEKYIRDALEGFVMQKTNFSFEVIVYDDASTDETTGIIHEYEKNYPDIVKPVYQKNNTYTDRGRFFKYVLPRIQGKYIALCEGDDYWIDVHKLQSQYDYIESHADCSLVAHMSRTYLEDEKIYKAFTNYDFVRNGVDIYPNTFILNCGIIATASMFFRTDFYREHQELLTKIPTFDFVLKYLLATEGYVHVIPRVMSVYRKGSIGSWSQRIASNKINYLEHLDKSISYIHVIDGYREYKYSDIFQKEINSRKFHMEMLNKNICALWQKKFSHISLRIKVIALLENFAPFVFHVLRLLKHIFVGYR